MKPAVLTVAIASIALAAPLRAADKVTYNDQVLPIFRNSCLNCHNPDKKKAGLDLSTYQAALAGSDNGKVLESGNAGGSLLVKCVKQTEDPKMPPKGDKLSDSDIATLEKWITGQLLETATGKAVAASNNVAVAVVSLDRPSGPPPMPGDLPLEPTVHTQALNAVVALAASPWAPLVAVGGQKQVVLYNTETLQTLGILPFPEGFPSILRFSRNGKLLLTGGGLGGKSGEVVLWDIATGERAGTVGNEFDTVLGADLSPDQAHVALGGPGKLLKIYATKDGKLEFSLKKHTDWITAIAYSPDGKYLASADRNGGIVVWEAGTATEFNTLPGHKVAVTALAFMPGVLASASEDGTIVLWDIKEAKEIRKWNAHAGGAEWVDFTPDGRLVSCGRDHLAKAWDQTGKNLLTSSKFDDITLRAVLNGDRVVAGDWTGKIHVFALGAGGSEAKPLGDLTPNPPAIADQLAVAEKQLTEAQAALPALQKEAEEAAAKKSDGAPAPAPAPAPAAAPAGPSAAKIAALQKKVDDLNAEIARRREARAKLENGTAEYNDANARVQEIKPQIAEAENKLAEASKAPAAPPAPPKAKDPIAETKAALEAGQARLVFAQGEISRWKRAQAFMEVHNTRRSLLELQAQFDGFSAAAKDALTPAESLRAQIASDAKAAAAAPDRLKQKEAELAEARAAGDPLTKAVTTAEESLKTKEAAAKASSEALQKATADTGDLPKKLEQQTAEVAKLREERAKFTDGTPEFLSANEKVQAKKAEIATTQAAVDGSQAKVAGLKTQAESTLAEVAKARDAIEPARLAAKNAAEKIAAAEKSLADVKKEAEATTARLADERKKEPEVAVAAKAAKAKAEQDAAAVGHKLEAAKTRAEKARADFDSHFPTVKTAAAEAETAARLVQK